MIRVRRNCRAATWLRWPRSNRRWSRFSRRRRSRRPLELHAELMTRDGKRCWPKMSSRRRRTIRFMALSSPSVSKPHGQRPLSREHVLAGDADSTPGWKRCHQRHCPGDHRLRRSSPRAHRAADPVHELERALEAGESFIPDLQPVIDIMSGRLRAPRRSCAGARWMASSIASGPGPSIRSLEFVAASILGGHEPALAAAACDLNIARILWQWAGLQTVVRPRRAAHFNDESIVKGRPRHIRGSRPGTSLIRWCSKSSNGSRWRA